MNRFASIKLSFWVFMLFLVPVCASSFIQLISPRMTKIPNNKYEKQWNTVDSLEELRLSKDALTKVDEIYALAKADNNSPQIIKSILYKLKFKNELEEDVFQHYIADLDKELETKDPVLKSILYSVKAQIIWYAYESNRWSILERTAITVNEDNLNSWDAEKYMDESKKYYMLSLKEDAKLKAIPVENFEDILDGDSVYRPYRPTLFDLLANRAIEHFSNHEANLNKPAYAFELDDPKYFSSYAEFIKINLTTQDTSSANLFVIQLYKQLLSYHSTSGYEAALLDADLKRLEYVYSHYVGANKSSLYLDALKSIYERNKAKNNAADVILALATFYKDRAYEYNVKEGETDKKYYYKKAWDLCHEIVEKHPKSIHAGSAKNRMNEIDEPTVSFTTENAYSSDISNLFLLKFKNIDKVYLRIAAVNYEEFREKREDYNGYHEWLIKQKPLKEWSQNLPNDKLFHEHSTEMELPPLKKGFYILLAGDSASFSSSSVISYSQFFVSNLATIDRAPYNKGVFEAIVVDRNTGIPISNAEVSLFSRTYQPKTGKYTNDLIKNLQSDKDGRVSYEYTSGRSEQFHYRIKYADDYWVNEEYNYVYKYNNETKEQGRTSFFTDRGIYRPGQTVYFKGIKIKTNGPKNELIVNTTTEVIFKDANGQEISKQKLKVNDFGSFQGSFVIPQGLATGSFNLSDANGNKSIQVEEYKRPKFEVNIHKPTQVYRVNDNILIKGDAKALAGFNITNAKVQYRVYRQANFPMWYRGWYDPSSQQEITFGKTSTDDKGEFVISFKALPDKAIEESSDPTFTYLVNVEVTDDAGETRMANEHISAGYKTLTISASIPDLINMDDIKPWGIYVNNLNDVEQKVPVKIQVERLASNQRTYRSKLWEKPDVYVIDEADYKKKFPYDVYKNEDEHLLLKAEETVFDGVYNTSDSLGFVLKNKSLKPGLYRSILTTKDPYGKEVKSVHEFTLYQAKDKASPIADFLYASSLKNSVESGETAQFYLATSQKIKVLYEIEQDGKIIKRELLNLNKEQQIISIPILESYRGNIHVKLSAVFAGRSYLHGFEVYVPFTNKELNVKLETFRDKMLPGSKEEWKVNVTPKLGEREAAELLLGMYDASLDAFVNNDWFLHVWHSKYAVFTWKSTLENVNESDVIFSNSRPYEDEAYYDYEKLNWFGLQFDNYNRRRYAKADYRDKSIQSRGNIIVSLEDSESELRASPAPTMIGVSETYANAVSLSAGYATSAGTQESFQARSNFSETAFFYPQLKTDEKGNTVFSFTMPESLTKWKFMGMAHTKSLQVGTISQEMVTQKDLMINTFAPRFLREGDELFFSAKITNLTDMSLSGKTYLELKDPITDKDISSEFGIHILEIPFSVKAGESTPAEWKIKIPFNRTLVKYSVKAISADFSDGEENVLPILSNRMLVTETLPIWMNEKGSKNYDLSVLTQSSLTRQNLKLSIEFTSNPAWYAVQSLPYLMEYPYECAEQSFSRLYANSIAAHIANSDPKIKAVFDTWKNYEPNALQSKLEKNQDLKNILLEETPWVRDANTETERKQRLGILFDINRMKDEQKSTLRKLQDMQVSNGGFPWFKGGPDDRYITQHIVAGFGKITRLGIKEYDISTNTMLKNAMLYLDKKLKEDYDYLLRNKVDLKKNNISHIQIHYLYARTFFTSLTPADEIIPAIDYYRQQCISYWNKQDDYSMAMIAITFQRIDQKKTAETIIASLKNRSIYSDELGMYWKGMLQGGYYWYNSPIENMALMIEAFSEVTSSDRKSIDGMKRWLLKNKQTNDWKTTKATADASYALLMNGTNLLTTNNEVKINFKNKAGNTIEVPTDKSETGTGYIKSEFKGNDIANGIQSLTIFKGTDGTSWGSVYWQYLDDMDKITKPSTPNPLSLSKKLFREVKTDRGLVLEEVKDASKLEVGERIISRIVLTSDRPMEYVHLKDMRASGLEPENVISQYKYQQGLGYYESTRDVANHFFISYVPRGTFVFEYPSRVTHKGNFSNGISQIQCMYTPEFTFHSEGIRINIK